MIKSRPRVLAVLVAAAVPLAAVPAAASPVRAPAGGDGEVPRPAWHDCPATWGMPAGWQCAMYPVPRDYARPGGGTLSLALARLPAKGRSKGSVFFNPGGPGGSGLDAASLWKEYVGASVRRSYDLVTWAPRGVIPSRKALRCTTDAQYEKASPPDAVLTEREMRHRLNASADIARRCAKRPLTPYVTTVDNVRDLDRLRQAVRDKRLGYVGISYGTVIGAVYANLYPGRYRALVLHGVVDSVTWSKPTFVFTKDDARELERTFAATLRACDAAPKNCAFAPRATAKYAELLAVVRKRSLAAHDSRMFTGLNRLAHQMAVGVPQASRPAAEQLQAAYNELLRRRSAESPTLLEQAAKPQRPIVRGTGEETNSGNVRDATLCSDAGRMTHDRSAWVRAARAADRQATTFGTGSVLDRSMCASWTAYGARHAGGWGAGRRPILLLNERWDHATPLAWARTMARRLGETRLITIEGFGHGIQTPCGRGKVDHYLLTGHLPKGTTCEDGPRPF
ncbi:alpha/beta fold hydrolase [Actinomadura parmotrematis]|uniref:Alpha/beta hydrolase n=1 Tax=Actinomadura parmotrematis TaxID=2864039 RepID=A0ABS7G1M1_9ACTN|nr:alpha/beta hydrolase [Actinomadura parmotrematis]MBW8486607.1 alpha/beta hydrolase [Actinomadura parmotrematis]